MPLTSIAADEILDEADLPMRLMAYSPCYRREAGSAGRDTRGLLRVHEFDKVELFAYATPEQAPAVLDEMVARAEALIAALGLAYRVLDICTGDHGPGPPPLARHRGLRPRRRPVARGLVGVVVQRLPGPPGQHPLPPRAAGKGTELVHTLNGSALAVPRVWAALVETHRQPDGTVTVPEALRPYFRGIEVIGA